MLLHIKPISLATLMAILLLLPSQSRAQAPRHEASLQVGPSLSWLRGNRVIDETDALLGAAAALNIQFGLSEHLSLRTGVGYQRKGTESAVTLTDINGATYEEGEVKSTYDYLIISVMLRAAFGSKAQVVVGLGPYAGYLIRSQYLFSGLGSVPSSESTDEHKAWDAGLSLSLGGSIPLGDKLALQAEVRYDKGLTDINAFPVVGDGNIRTNAVALLLGCAYRFGGTS